MTDDARVELESGRFDPLARSRVARVEDRHVVFLRHLVDRVEEGEEILLRVDILFAVSGEEDISSLFEAETLMDVGGFDLREIGVEHLGHRGAGDIGSLFGESAIGEVTPRVFGVRHIDVGDDIDDTAIRLFGKTFVFAAVSGFHVEYRDMQSLGADNGKTGVGVAED